MELEARAGSAEKLPLSDGSMDVVASFETIEHVPNPSKFLEECARVLSAEGVLIVSTPNKGVYAWEGGGANPHHCSEMAPEEFEQALRERSTQRIMETVPRVFRSVEFYTQRPYTAHWWSLRALAAERPPGWHSRVVRRLRHAVRVRVAPKLFVNAPSVVRNSVVETIGQISSEGHSFLIHS